MKLSLSLFSTRVLQRSIANWPSSFIPFKATVLRPAHVGSRCIWQPQATHLSDFLLGLIVRLQVLQGQDISENHSNPRSPYSNGACQIKVTSEMV